MTNGPTKLLGQLPQQRLAGQVPPGSRDLLSENLGEREVLEECDDVRECLVEREAVRMGRLDESAVHPVKQSVGRLVRDYVMREACEHHPSRELAARVARGRGKYPKSSAFLLGL